MRWIHLSDIHFGYTNASVDTMRKKLLEKVQELEQVDCLFITGDLRYGKNAPNGYPQETLDFLLDLRNALKLEPQDIYIVPGNHDLERCSALTSIIEGALKQYSTLDGRLASDTLDYIATRRSAFKKLYSEVCGRNALDWHYCETRADFNIICLNTAILCGTDGEDGNLVVGSELLNRLSDTVDKSKPAIVLAHHDFDSFRLEEQQKLEICLKELGAVLYLCGHKHVALSRLQNTYRTDRDLRVFLCGTNMDQAPQLSQTDMDFFVGQTDNGSTGWVQAYKWYPRRSLWLADNEFSSSQDEAIDGIVYFPKNTRPNIRPCIQQDVLEKYRSYIQVQCGEIELNGMPINEQEVSHRFDLYRLFVPLRFSHFQTSSRSIGEEKEISYSLAELVPVQGVFREFILSDPGGGKSTLLKWMASVYCFPEKYQDVDTHLPQRELFPVWLRCRDIPEGSRPTIWTMIKDIAIRGEWLPHGSNAVDFSLLVAKYLDEGKMLLLIDGLDEIGSEVDREHFVDQLRIFAELYPSASIIVTSRPTGVSLITQKKFSDFQYLQIDPLDPDDIKCLCLKWNQVVRGDTAEVRNDAKTLAEHIIENERVLRLASNPMLLTTLLLVERRVGRLPTKRVELYEEAIRVLLETWNSRGHAQHRIDLDEARYQLAYIAYYMTTRQTDRKTQLARITRSELLKQLKNARRELAELISHAETPSQFIQNIEHRSALLIQKGYEENELGEREAVYEFQHLTFQEYLAAYALIHSCYPGATEDDDPISVVSPHLTNPNMREVIPLIAVRLHRFYPSRLVDEILAQMNKPDVSIISWNSLRSILLQLVADEAALSPAKVDQILETCFEFYYNYEDKDVFIQILEGKNAERLITRFRKMDQEQNDGFDYHISVLRVLSKQIENPIQHYLAHRKNPNIRERANSITIFSCLYSLKIAIESSRSNIDAIPELKSELFSILDEKNPILQHAALWGLQDCDLIKSPEDWSRYLEGFIRYANNSDRFLCIVSAISLPNVQIPFNSELKLSDQGLQRLLCAIKNHPINVKLPYGRLATMVFLGTIASSEYQDITPLFQSFYDVQKNYIGTDPVRNYLTYYVNQLLYNLLNKMVLNGDYSEARKTVIRRHILKSDFDWATAAFSEKVFVPRYCDYSADEPVSFEADLYVGDFNPEEYMNQVVAHIRSRMEALGIS